MNDADFWGPVLDYKAKTVCLILLLSLVVSNAPGCQREHTIQSSAPDRIILIVLDSLRWDHLSSNGYERQTSPWMDDLAQKSINFNRAFSPANMTKWSTAMYFSSRYFSRMWRNAHKAQGIPKSVQTIPQILSKKKIKSFVWSTNSFVSEENGFARGTAQFSLLKPLNSLINYLECLIVHRTVHVCSRKSYSQICTGA